MTQKRVLVVGAILVAAGIGAPTTAYLAPGGTLSEPRKPEVEVPAPGPAGPPADQVDDPPSGPPASPRASANPRRQTTPGATTPPGATRRPVPKPGLSRTQQPADRQPPPDRGAETARPDAPFPQDWPPPPQEVQMDTPQTAWPDAGRDTADW